MKGLTEVTAKTLIDISGCDFLKEYTFIGGSAIAVQIEHRLSEDLDFCKWKVHANIQRIALSHGISWLLFPMVKTIPRKLVLKG